MSKTVHTNGYFLLFVRKRLNGIGMQNSLLCNTENTLLMTVGHIHLHQPGWLDKHCNGDGPDCMVAPTVEPKSPHRVEELEVVLKQG
eukprot:3606073-Amphidinium_carterae.1